MSPGDPPAFASSELGLKAYITIPVAHGTSLFTHLYRHVLLDLRKMTLGDWFLKAVGVLMHTKTTMISLGHRCFEGQCTLCC